MRSRALFAFGFVVGLGSLACDKDKPKPDETKKSEPVPVPSNLVFNDFIPATGAGGVGLGVRDSGIEGGLAEVAAGGGAEADPAAAGGAAGKEAPVHMKVTEPGSEPRAVRKYTFVAGRVEKRMLTIQQTVTQSAGGQTAPGQSIVIKIGLDLTAKQVKPAGALMEAKVTKVELPGAPAQATAAFAQMVGLSGTFELSSKGEAGEVQFTGSAQMKGQAAEPIIQGLSQAVQLLVAPLPDAPIGTGAKWELGAGNPQSPDQGVKHFHLKEVSAEGGVVDVDIDVKVPKRATQSPRGGTMFVEVDGKGKYLYQMKFDRVSPKVEGELSMNEKIEIPDPRSGQRQTVTQTQKAKQTIETMK